MEFCRPKLTKLLLLSIIVSASGFVEAVILTRAEGVEVIPLSLLDLHRDTVGFVDVIVVSVISGLL